MNPHDTQRATLLRRFEPALSPAASRLFATLIEHAETIDEQDGAVLCALPEGTWVLEAPWPDAVEGSAAVQRGHRELVERIERCAPASLRALLHVCAGMTWGEPGNTGQLVLHPGFSGTVHALGEDAVSASDDGFDFDYSPTLCAPIDIDSGDFYVVHPDTGELLYQTEGCVMRVVDTLDPVEIYLREMHHELKDVSSPSPFRDAAHRTAWLADYEPRHR
jgi:hypothetical protein